MKVNNRINNLDNYHFKKLDDLKSQLIMEGKEVIDLSIGDPDISVESRIINGLIRALYEESYNNYPPYDGLKMLKDEIIKYYKEVYSVNLDDEEVLILIGSKEGISNIIPAVCDIGDELVITSPAYPVYSVCSKLWGARPYTVPLSEKNEFLPDLRYIPDNILRKSKMFFINYPNNPTGAIANEDFYKEIIDICEQNDIVLCNDGAYNEIIETDTKPLSILKYDKNKFCVEFGTFSKTFSMTGFRIGYVVGNKKVISALLKIKSNVDSGVFKPIQCAAIEALHLNRNYVKEIRTIYCERRRTAEKILDKKNIRYYSGKGTFYIWCKVPEKYTTDEFCKKVLFNSNVLITPGYAFGNLGYDYFRIALTKTKEIISKALNKLDSY